MAKTYDELSILMQDFTFRGRIKVSCLTYSTYILNEPPSTDGHSSRYRWAQNVGNQPDVEAARLQPMICMDDRVKEQGSDISDSDLQAATETVVNKFL